MFDAFLWWLIIELLGLAALPLAWRFFARLPDRGYALAKPLGLLLASYLFWLLVTFGFLRNTRTAIGFAIFVVAVVAWGLGRDAVRSLRDWLAENWRVLAASEVLFAVAFAGWTVYRAYNPEIMATEKPMEFAFLNAILRSETFPPYDPWLSGFAISYYYFGYLMMALLTKLSGVPSEVAFNLGIALLFALTITGAFSIVYNLVQCQLVSNRRQARGIGFGLLGSFFVTILGNLEGLFELLHARGIGWDRLWQLLDINNLATAPPSPTWYPIDNWWWWRASRVLQDKPLFGQGHIEVIDEFPFFSFMLGDMHPHVLALPFVFVALGIALNMLQEDNDAKWPALLLPALCLGALGFLNTWDFPIYLFLVVVAYAVNRFRVHGGIGRQCLIDVAYRAIALLVLGVLLYLPFYIGFQSQAGGLLPNLFNLTWLPQFLVFFGPFLFVVVGFLAVLTSQGGLHGSFLRALLWALVLPLLALLVSIIPVLITSSGRVFLEGLLSNPTVQEQIGAHGWLGLAGQIAALRILNPWVYLLLVVLVAWAFALLRRGRPQPTGSNDFEPSTTFVLLILLVGLLLPLAVEFVYLRDTFGTRMNTVFKFYYQAWVLLAIAAAYGLHFISGQRSAIGGWRWTWLVGSIVLTIAASYYPFAAGFTRANNFIGPPTLDGIAWIRQTRPDDYAAIQWLRANVRGSPVILEAPGGSYTDYGRVSEATGLPTVVGWGGHELQWRGSGDEAGRRESEVEMIYTSLDEPQVVGLLEKYSVRYVYVGPLEQGRYDAAGLAKFAHFMDVVYDHDGVTIYRR